MINEVLTAPEDGFTVEGMEVRTMSVFLTSGQICISLWFGLFMLPDKQLALGWDGCGLRQGECCRKGGYQDNLSSGG